MAERRKNLWGQFNEALLAQRSLTEQQFAELTDVLQPTINRWKYQRAVRMEGPTQEWLQRAIEVLGLPEPVAQQYVLLAFMIHLSVDHQWWLDSLLSRMTSAEVAMGTLERENRQVLARLRHCMQERELFIRKLASTFSETSPTRPALRAAVAVVPPRVTGIPETFPELVRLMIARNLSINDVLRDQ